jgi:RIO kinase 2
LISKDSKLTIIDFPQCISSNHGNAREYFNRDVECLYVFFDKLVKKNMREEEDGQIHINKNDIGFKVSEIEIPVLDDIVV